MSVQSIACRVSETERRTQGNTYHSAYLARELENPSRLGRRVEVQVEEWVRWRRVDWLNDLARSPTVELNFTEEQYPLP